MLRMDATFQGFVILGLKLVILGNYQLWTFNMKLWNVWNIFYNAWQLSSIFGVLFLNDKVQLVYMYEKHIYLFQLFFTFPTNFASFSDRGYIVSQEKWIQVYCSNDDFDS